MGKEIINIIEEEINEVRYVSGYEDIDLDKPLKDSDTIIVYHGFNKFNEALLTSKFGLSGGERAKRIYSYEAGNNPKGLFVSVDFNTVKNNFASGGVVMEFATKVSDLEAPAWVGGRSYFVQGEYTQSFKDDEERHQQQLANREKHSGSEYPAISNSDRPELAWALYEGGERQALFIGDLNPNMIRGFWVNEKLIKERRIDGKWERLSRQEFVKKYLNDDNLKTQYVGDDKPRYSDEYYDKQNKIFRPNDDFDVDVLKQYLDESDYDYDDFVEQYIKNWDNYIMNTYFYPKQLKQIKKYYDVPNPDPDVETPSAEPRADVETKKEFVKRVVREYLKTNKINGLPDFKTFKDKVLSSGAENKKYFDGLHDRPKQNVLDMLYQYYNKLEQIKDKRSGARY